MTQYGLPDSSVGKESACNAGDPGSIPGSGRSAGEGLKMKNQKEKLRNQSHSPLQQKELNI